MSLSETTELLCVDAIVLGALVFAVFRFSVHPLRKKATANAEKLLVPNLAGIPIRTSGELTPLSRPPLDLSRKSRATLRGDVSDANTATTTPADTPTVLPTLILAAAESLPTFNEVWARKTAVQSYRTSVERTPTVKEQATRMHSPVLLPEEKDLLPEGLRTLEVTPNRTVEPGKIVYAGFTFRNLGGAAATGFRVRFRLPAALAYVAGTAKIDGVSLADRDDQTLFVQQSGAQIGAIAPGGERRLSLAYRVADVIEDGSTILLQAAVASPSVGAIGTNIVQLTVRSSPVLQTAETLLTVSATERAVPGDELRLNARIHNSGQSTAHDIVACLPVPAYTSFIPQSATIGGRSLMLETQRQSFGSAGRIVAQTLEPGETVNIAYRVRIDSPLDDATVVVVHGTVCSQEVGQFALQPVSILIASAPSFDSAETSVKLECANDVRPGETIRVVAVAKNVGTAVARDLVLRIALPDGLSYAPGSLTIDGASTVDNAIAPGTIALADIVPGESVDLSISVSVQSPIADGQELLVLSTIGWSGGKRDFTRTLTTRSAARFPLHFNKIERIAPYRVAPADALTYSMSLHNMGTDTATDVKLQLVADAGIERLRLWERQNELQLDSDGSVELGSIGPGVARAFRIDGQVGAAIEDETRLCLRAALCTAQAARVELGAAVHVVDSAPAFSLVTSGLIVLADAPVEGGGTVRARLILVNEGTDRAKAVRVRLVISDELHLENVDGEACPGGVLEFDDVAAGERREAELALSLTGIATGERVEIGARLSAANLMPVTLTPVAVAIHAEPSFEFARLSTVPSERVDAGAEITYTLTMRNTGSGKARRLTARLTTLSDAVYAQGSTSVNGIALEDHAGTSLLLSPGGLTLADVAPGVEAVVRWCAIVHTPLAPSTLIDSVVAVGWDEAPEMFVSAESLEVQSTSALPVFEPSLPFSVLGAVAARKITTALALPTSGRSSDAVTKNGVCPR